MRTNLHLLRRSGLMLICLSMLSVRIVSAADVVVAPGYGTLSVAVAAASAGDVLILTRGETYSIDTEISIEKPITIKGDGLPTDILAPPVVSFIAESGAFNGLVIFKISANTTLQNFGVQGFSDLNEQGGPIIKLFASKIKLEIDGMYFQGGSMVLNGNSQENCEIIEKNCTLFNINIYNKEDNWNGFNMLLGGPGTILRSYNNTFMNVTRLVNDGVASPTSEDYLNHNTYVNIFGDTFYPCDHKVMKVTNNIFFNTQLRGYVGPVGDYAGDFIGDWAYDVLMGDISINPIFTETRDITITKNLKFNAKKVLDFNTTNNITVQPFISDSTWIIAASKGWNLAGNYINTDAMDPGITIPDDAYTRLFEKSLARRLPGNEGEYIGWIGDKDRNEFIWPLPFNLKPTNSAIYTAGTDGYPLGDLNWFGKDVVKAWEEGKPNPISVAPTSEIKKVKGTPAVDGTVNSFWADVQANVIDKPFTGEAPTLSSATWKSVWNDDGIFLLVEVSDDVFSPPYEGTDTKTWNYDHPEIYFDVNAVLADGKGPTGDGNGGGNGHYQFGPGFEKGKISGGAPLTSNGCNYSFMVTGSNYVGEYFVPFSKLLDKDKKAMDKTKPIGFDVYICDADLKTGDRRRQVWSNVGKVNEAWATMDACGTITLSNTVIADVTSVRNLNESKQTAYIANDMLRFKGYDKAVDAEIYSILGQKLLVAKNINELNVSSLIHGVYLVRVNNGSQAFRVVK